MPIYKTPKGTFSGGLSLDISVEFQFYIHPMYSPHTETQLTKPFWSPTFYKFCSHERFLPPLLMCFNSMKQLPS